MPYYLGQFSIYSGVTLYEACWRAIDLVRSGEIVYIDIGTMVVRISA